MPRISVPVHGSEERILAIGGCSGSDTDKFAEFHLDVCSPGWQPLPADTVFAEKDPSAAASDDAKEAGASSNAAAMPSAIPAATAIADAHDLPLIALVDTVAHLCCSVVSHQEVDGHFLCICKIDSGFVKSSYWNGKNFIPQDDVVPPYLTFLGSQTFALVRPS